MSMGAPTNRFEVKLAAHEVVGCGARIVAILIFCGVFLLSNSFGIKEIWSVANENPLGTDDLKSKLSM